MFRCLYFAVLAITVFISVGQARCHNVIAQETLNSEIPRAAFCYGSVLGPAEQPLPNARVELIRTKAPWFPLAAPVIESAKHLKADCHDGQFQFELSMDDSEFWIAAEKGFIKVSAPGHETIVQEIRCDRLFVDLPFSFSLKPIMERPVRVLDAAGKPIANAQVSPSLLKGIRLYAGVFDEKSTDDDGYVQWEGVPSDAVQEVSIVIDQTNGDGPSDGRIEGPREGQRCAVQWVEGVPTAKLQPIGKLKVQFLLDGQPLALQEAVDVQVRSTSVLQLRFDEPYPLAWKNSQIKTDGTIAVDDLPYGSLILNLPTGESFPYVFKEIVPSLPKLGTDNTEVSVKVDLVAAEPVVFTFVDSEGAPIPRLPINSTDLRYRFKTTDSQGQFVVWSAKGRPMDGQLFFHDPFGRKYQEPFGINTERVDRDEAGELKPVQLATAKALQGKVVDQNGQTVSGATIEYSFGEERFNRQETALSDKSGGFVLRTLPPGALVSLKAKHGQSITTKTIEVQAGTNAEIVLQIHPQPAASFVGRLIAANQLPISGATVILTRGQVVQKEAYSFEELQMDKATDLPTVVSDEDGYFEFPETIDFAGRLQVLSEKEGCYPFKSMILDASKRTVADGKLDLGTFQLSSVAKEVDWKVTVADESGNVIPNAEIAMLGVRSGRGLFQCSEKGVAQFQWPAETQLMAVYAPGYALSLQWTNPKSVTEVVLANKSERTLTWATTDELRDLANQLFQQLTPVQSSESHVRKYFYWKAKSLAEPDDFVDGMASLDLEYKSTLLFLSFLDTAPHRSVSQLNLQANWIGSADRVGALSQLAYFESNEERKDELYAEALVELRNLSIKQRQTTSWQIVALMLLDGRPEMAKFISEEIWAESDELKKILATGEKTNKLGVARRFLPVLALTDIEAALQLVNLISIGREVDSSQAECVMFLSLLDDDAAVAKAAEHKIQLSSGVYGLFLANRVQKVKGLYQWASNQAQKMEVSKGKLEMLLFAARQSLDPKQQSETLQEVANVWSQLSVMPTYYWDDPVKTVLEYLPSVTDAKQGDLDELIWVSLKQCPTSFASSNLLGVYANRARLIALRDPALAGRMLEPSMEYSLWCHDRQLIESSPVLGALAYCDPVAARTMIESLAAQMSPEDETAMLKLYSSVISGIGTRLQAGQVDQQP